MRIIELLVVLFLVFMLFSWALADASPSGITRHEIQDFLKQPGNAIVNPVWTKSYQNRQVRWQGVVYKIDVLSDSQPAEILIKILPSRRLYDTVLTVPANHPLLRSLQPGQSIEFQGVITGVVDTMFLKEVHVMLYEEQSAIER